MNSSINFQRMNPNPSLKTYRRTKIYVWEGILITNFGVFFQQRFLSKPPPWAKKPEVDPEILRRRRWKSHHVNLLIQLAGNPLCNLCWMLRSKSCWLYLYFDLFIGQILLFYLVRCMLNLLKVAQNMRAKYWALPKHCIK